jgi:hypothetical protein
MRGAIHEHLGGSMVRVLNVLDGGSMGMSLFTLKRATRLDVREQRATCVRSLKSQQQCRRDASCSTTNLLENHISTHDRDTAARKVR